MVQITSSVRFHPLVSLKGQVPGLYCVSMNEELEVCELAHEPVKSEKLLGSQFVGHAGVPVVQDQDDVADVVEKQRSHRHG